MIRILILTLLLLAFQPRLERGYVLDFEGNGISVKADGSPVDEVYNYVQYNETEKGTEILSIFLYNPKYIGRHEDDSIYRKDFILSKGNDIQSYVPYTNRLYTSEAYIVIDDGNIYKQYVIMDNKGTSCPTDDTVKSVY